MNSVKGIDSSKSVAVQPLTSPTTPRGNIDRVSETEQVSERATRLQARKVKLARTQQLETDALEGEQPFNVASTSRIPVRSPARSDKLQSSNQTPKSEQLFDVSAPPRKQRQPSDLRHAKKHTDDESVLTTRSKSSRTTTLRLRGDKLQEGERETDTESVRTVQSSCASSSCSKRDSSREMTLLMRQFVGMAQRIDGSLRELTDSMQQSNLETARSLDSTSRRTTDAIDASAERSEKNILAAMDRSNAFHQASLQTIVEQLAGRNGIQTTYDTAGSPATTSTTGEQELTIPKKKPKIDTNEPPRELSRSRASPSSLAPSSKTDGGNRERVPQTQTRVLSHVDASSHSMVTAGDDKEKVQTPVSPRQPLGSLGRIPSGSLPSGSGESRHDREMSKGGGDDRRARSESSTPVKVQDEEPPDKTGDDSSIKPLPGDPTLAPDPPSSYKWEELGLSSWEQRATREYTPGDTGITERHSSFRARICQGIIDAINNVTSREPCETGPNAFLKSIAAVTTVPSYGGEDDLEVFMTWLQNLMTFIDMNEIVGESKDYTRAIMTRAALIGPAQVWFDTTIRLNQISGYREMPKFVDVILRLSDAFITPAAATRSQHSFERVVYDGSKGIRAYVRELQMISYHLLMPVDEYTLRRRIVDAIPWRIRNHLIDFKSLSTSTSSVVEWVDAVERRERDLLERYAYDTVSNQPARATVASKATLMQREETPKRTTVRTQTTRMVTTKPVGPVVNSRQRLSISEITCHACGVKGHYKGSVECPKTPTSAHLHAIGGHYEQGYDEGQISPEMAIDETFEGEDYDGEPDIEVTQEEDDDTYGAGVAIANIHVEDLDDEDDVTIAQLAATKVAETKGDSDIADELLKTVRAQYEERGSGMKAPLHGPSAKQLRADSQKVWASNPNIKNPKDPTRSKIRRGRCLTAIVNVDGVEAFMCWDTGSELDTISPDFVRAMGLQPKAKENPIKIRLGTKGSTSMTSYEVSATLNFGKTKLKKWLDVVNLDRWDVILGATFCEEQGVILDFGKRQVRFSDTVIHALSKDDEAEVRKGDRPKPRSKQKTRLAALTKDA